MGGNLVRGDVVTWRADGRVFVSVSSRSTDKMNGAKPANMGMDAKRKALRISVLEGCYRFPVAQAVDAMRANVYL